MARKDPDSEPGRGLIGGLVRAEQDGQSFSQRELETMVTLLLLAGMETTTHLISGALWALDTRGGLEKLDQVLRWIFPQRRDRSEEKKNAFS